MRVSVTYGAAALAIPKIRCSLRRKTPAALKAPSRLRLPSNVRLLLLSAVLCSICAGTSASEDRDWSHYQKDPQGTRYSRLTEIHRANVQQLEVAWRYHTGGASDELKTTIECNPLVIDGVMYITS